MRKTVRITSKNQITLPSKLAQKYNFKKGDLLVVKDAGDAIYLTKEISVLDQLAGSVKTPPHLKGVPIEKIVKQAREEHYKERLKKKGF